MFNKDVLKKNSILIFDFFDDCLQNIYNKINKIKIGNLELDIDLKLEKIYKVNFSDYINSDYRIYTCTFIFDTTEIEFGICVYFNRTNYYYCDVNQKNDPKSIEIIFSDFSEKNLKDCYIEYNNHKFDVKENFNDIKTRKRISIINIDLNKIKLPKKKNKQKGEKDIEFTTKGINFKNILISIYKGKNSDNIIGIFKNQPYTHFDINKKQIIKDLKNIIEPSKNYLNYKNNKSFDIYFNNINHKNPIYKEGLIKSEEFYQNSEIEKFFLKYNPLLDECDLEIYKLYSEFLLLFPKIKNKTKNQTYFYIKQYYFSKKAIENFRKTIPNNITEKEKIILEYTACRVLFALLSNEKGNYVEEIFEFIDFKNENSIYHAAVEHNKRFINLLKEDSEIFPFFLQLNSGSSSNYLDQNNLILSSRISMLSLNQIRNHLKSCILDYGIRIKVLSYFNALTLTETRITIFSEINIFGNYLTNLDINNDYEYNKRFVLSNIMKHEQFGHIKFSINDSSFNLDNPPFIKSISQYESYSPVETYSPLNDEFNEIYDPNLSSNDRGESGYSFSFYLTRGDKSLYNFLENKDANFKELFQSVELMVSNDLSEFCKKLKKLVDENGNEEKKEEEIKQEKEKKVKGKLFLYKKNNEEIIITGIPRTEKI